MVTRKLRPPEPAIAINGTSLSDGQALTVREACEQFLLWLNDEIQSEPNDRILQGYRERVREVVTLLHNHVQ